MSSVGYYATPFPPPHSLSPVAQFFSPLHAGRSLLIVVFIFSIFFFTIPTDSFFYSSDFIICVWIFFAPTDKLWSRELCFFFLHFYVSHRKTTRLINVFFFTVSNSIGKYCFTYCRIQYFSIPNRNFIQNCAESNDRKRF